MQSPDFVLGNLTPWSLEKFTRCQYSLPPNALSMRPPQSGDSRSQNGVETED